MHDLVELLVESIFFFKKKMSEFERKGKKR